MASTTVRISQETREALRELAEQVGEPMHKVLAKAVEAYRRQCILEKSNVAYAALRADPKAWQEEQQERRVWDSTLADGMERE
jgi:predicted transcriptional regulator